MSKDTQPTELAPVEDITFELSAFQRGMWMANGTDGLCITNNETYLHFRRRFNNPQIEFDGKTFYKTGQIFYYDGKYHIVYIEQPAKPQHHV